MDLVTHCRPFLRFFFQVSEIHLEMLNSAFFETVLTFDEVAVTYCWVKAQILMVLEGSLEPHEFTDQVTRLYLSFAVQVISESLSTCN